MEEGAVKKTSTDIKMFHKAINLKFKEGTELELTFTDGAVKWFDVKKLFEKIPELKTLTDRSLFLSGKLMGYGIIWNESLDLDVETVYEDGETAGMRNLPGIEAGEAVLRARAEKDMTQKELSVLTGISQTDISRLEKGFSNSSVGTLSRIADALEMKLTVSIG